MATLHCSLLGPLHVECDNHVLKIQRHKAQALLAYLVVTRTAQARTTLAALLWPESDNRQALASLRRHLSELHSALGSSWIEADHETIRCAPDANIWLDIDDFTQQLARCASHGHAPAAVCPACIAPLSAAVARYHDDFLAGLTLPDAPTFDEWQFFQREALRQQLAGALDRLVQAHIANHEPTLAIPHARRRLRLDPLHEPAHRQLMTLYAATGQQAAALRQYDECVRLLDSELGVAPDEETTALYEKIRHGASSRSAGDLAELPATQQRSLHNLPAQTTPFIGREQEVATLLQLCRAPDQRLVTILGPGGIGKTRLAIEVASQLIDELPNGVFLVRLSQLSDPAHIVPAIADTLNFHFHGDGRSAQQQLFDYLAAKALLLVLDNFEHLLVGVDLVQTLLEHCPRLQMLVTSRERLQLLSETVFTLSSMDFPTWEVPEDTQKYSAIQLFLQTAQRIAPSRLFSTDEMQYVARICRLVSGIPLGIILAATWVEVLDPAAIAAELTHGFDLLETQLRDLPERQRSMRAVLAYSWHRLDEVERNAFARLSVFRGNFTRDAAQMVAGATLPILARLVGKSFVQPMSDGRYTIHELLRQYGTERLAESPESQYSARHRHAEYYSAFVQEHLYLFKGTGRPQAVADVEAEIGNIRAAWEWATKNEQAEMSDRMMDGLGYYYLWRGHWAEAEKSFGQAAVVLQNLLSQPRSLLPPSAAIAHMERTLTKSLTWQAAFQTQLGHSEAAEKLLRRSLTYLEQSTCSEPETLLLRAFTHSLMGSYFYYLDLTTCRQHHEQAVALYRQSSDGWLLAEALSRMGYDMLRGSGGSQDCQKVLAESVALYYAAGDQLGKARALLWQSQAMVEQGRFNDAERLIDNSLAICKEIGDKQGTYLSLHQLGVALIWQGRMAESHTALLEALSIAKDMGHPRYVGDTSRFLSLAAGGIGNFDEAIMWLDSIANISTDTDMNMPIEIAVFMFIKGIILSAMERYALALEALQESIDICQMQQHENYLRWSRSASIMALRGIGEREMARQTAVEELGAALQSSNLLALVQSVCSISCLLVDENKYEQALELYALGVTSLSAWDSELGYTLYKDAINAGNHMRTTEAETIQARGARNIWETGAALVEELRGAGW